MDQEWHLNQPPLYKRFQSIALIRKIENDRHLWLARWNQTKQHLEFVATPRLESESFRECIRREVGWVLELDSQRDFLVSNVAQINLEFVAKLPNDNRESHVAVAFYLVNLFRKLAAATVDEDTANRWLTSQEVWDGKAADDLPLDPQLVYLIRRSKVINAWD